MLCVLLKKTDPFYCLAAEEYLLKNFTEDIFMLWQSDKTIVVGKHQNALAEINYPFVRENNITVARRISGGGTVYHDSGNVNFSFIKNVKSPAEISFKMFTRPVVEALAKLGVEATTSGRNDLLINGLKISGNAEHVFKNRVLHHGTLLFNSDLKNLGQAIKVIPGKYEGKAVQSNRSKVANISSFLETKMDIKSFTDFLISVQLEKEGNKKYEMSRADHQTIKRLAIEKFQSWDWRFGYSPKYAFTNIYKTGDKTLSVRLQVIKGEITACTLSGNLFSQSRNKELSTVLEGKMHRYDDVKKVVGSENEGIIYAFF